MTTDYVPYIVIEDVTFSKVMELSPVYCDVIIARWEKLTGRKAEKLVG